MDKLQILEQLFDNGYVIQEFTLEPTKIKIKLKSLSFQDYLDLDSKVSELKGTKSFILQTYAFERISRGLIKYKDLEFKNVEEVKEFLKNSKISNFLFNKMVEVQSKFEEEVRKSLGFENLENFFDQEGSPEKSKQQSEE